ARVDGFSGCGFSVRACWSPCQPPPLMPGCGPPPQIGYLSASLSYPLSSSHLLCSQSGALVREICNHYSYRGDFVNSRARPRGSSLLSFRFDLYVAFRIRTFRSRGRGADIAVCAPATGEEKTRSSHVRQNGTLAIDR